MMKTLREFAESSAAVLFAHLLARGSAAFAAVLVARNFPAPEFASYSYFQISISSLATLASFGLGTSAARYFAVLTRREPAGAEDFPLGALWLCGILAAFIAGVGLMLAPHGLIGSDSGMSRTAIAVGVAVLILTLVPSGAMVGLQLYSQSVLTSAASAGVLFTILTIAIARESVSMAMMAVVAGFAAQCMGDTVCVIRRVNLRALRRSSRLNRAVIAKIANFAGPMFLVSVLNAAALWITARIMRTIDASQFTFALYSIGMQWFALVLVLPSVLTKISIPLLVRYGGDGQERIARLGALLSFGCAAIGGALAIVGAPWIDRLYGEQYEVHRLLLLPFMVAALFNAPAGVLGNLIVVAGRQWAWLRLTLLASVVFVSVGWATRGYGAIGGGLAVCISSIVLAGFALLVLRGNGRGALKEQSR